MPRINNIKWRQTDEKELKRVVKNYNAKISRLIKKDPSLAKYIPNRVSASDIKNNITSRQDFNREMNSLNRFLKRGSETLVTSKSGITTTKYAKNEVAIQVGVINRRRTVKRKELEQLEATSRGKSLNMTRREMQSIRLNELRPKKFNFDKINKYEWDKYRANVLKQSRPNFQTDADLKLRENYIKGLIEVFGDTTDTRNIIASIEKLSLQDFVKQFYTEQEASIDFIYDPIEQKLKQDVLTNDVWDNQKIASKKNAKQKKNSKTKKK